MPKRSLYARAWASFTAMACACFMALATNSSAAQYQQPAPCAECIVLAASPEQSALITEELHGIEILVRAGEDAAALQSALERIRDHRGRPGLWVAGINAKSPSPETAALANRILLDLSTERETSDELTFRLKTYLTDLRSAGTAVQLGFYARREVLENLRQRGLDAYVDFIARDATAPPPFPIRGGSQTVTISRAIHEPRISDPAIRRTPDPMPSRTLAPADPQTHDSVGGMETSADRWVIRLPDDASSAQQFLFDVARTAPILPEGLISGGMVDIRCGDRAVATFLNPESLDTIAIVNECPDQQLAIASNESGSIRLMMSSGDIVVKVPSPEGRFAQGVDVRGSRTLSVREIIARHQAASARQRRRVSHLISTGRMVLTFEAPGFPAPMTISTDTVIYTERDLVDIEQRDVRVNGIALTANMVPRLPLLEPERVASLPLAIALTDVYRYSLDGEEVMAGIKCYVIRFEPVDRRRSLFAGRVWIAADEFAMVKVAAAQTGLRGPIVSSEQTDEFRREQADVWLLARSEVHQIYEGAGHRTPIHRLLTIDRHELNPPTFISRRQAAYAAPSIMLRDTPEGFRYLRRERTSDEKGALSAVPTTAAERVRTIAVGVIIDPNISRPLPFAGLSYVDFNLFGTGTQMNGFFGGTFGQLAIAMPSVGGTRWQLAARAFGIASSYNDRAFIGGREDYRANISQRPAHTSAWVVRPLTTRVTARVGYEFDYTAYGRVDSTSPSFLVPASQRAHGVRLGLDAQWARWSASAWWSGARRAGWREWGEGQGEYDSRHHEYQRFGLALTRAFVWSPRLVGRLDAAWMSGRDLDRFSRYSFGSFENRLHGYPSALIRYDRGGAVRAAAAWAADRRLRIDLFFDSAFVRDPGFGARARNYTGIGSALEIPAPFGTLAAIEWGYGFQGIDSDGRRGTQVIRVSGYKMF